MCGRYKGVGRLRDGEGLAGQRRREQRDGQYKNMLHEYQIVKKPRYTHIPPDVDGVLSQ